MNFAKNFSRFLVFSLIYFAVGQTSVSRACDAHKKSAGHEESARGAVTSAKAGEIGTDLGMQAPSLPVVPVENEARNIATSEKPVQKPAQN
jgi:hypothetical protein